MAIPRRLVRNWSADSFAGWLKSSDKDQLEIETVAGRNKELCELLVNNSSV